ncbi:MAG: preprotein translocase subunit YajC [Thermoguttaceae bacterium]|nr:preprotein translocase subunit YajC [Thermoguttaceae bacterium]
MNFTFLFPLAQAASEAAPAAGTAPQNPLSMTILWMVVLFGILWFVMIRPQQTEQKRRQQMWDGLKVYDKVITVGGIHGVITQITPDEGTLVLRIDESANIKIRLEISCIAAVLSEPKEEEKK